MKKFVCLIVVFGIIALLGVKKHCESHSQLDKFVKLERSALKWVPV